MGIEVFYGCSSLTSIPNNIKCIGEDAFRCCNGLININIPSSVTEIGSGAFSQCSNLTNVTISDGVTKIGNSAFGSCTKLTSIVIPSSVTTFGSYAFSACANLKTIYYTGTEEQWEEINKMSGWSNGTKWGSSVGGKPVIDLICNYQGQA
jgi:hypothetical protein